MNSVQEKQINNEVSEIQKRRIEERRRAAARKRAAEKRRRKKRMKLIMLTVCMVVVVACAVIVAVLPMSYENDAEVASINGSDVSTDVKGTEADIRDNKDNKKPDVKNPIKDRIKLLEKIEYYKAENAERYEEYLAANPDMPIEDIIWRVNANLDKPMYEFDIPVSGYDDPYMLVNKYYTVPEGYEPPDLKEFDGHLLRQETGEAYEKMRDDASKEGYYISVVSGYRSVEYQNGLYNRYLSTDSRENVDRYSARPGYSEHHTGMAMDIFGSNCSELRDFEKSPEYPWVRDNCYKYGFIIRYLEETESITGYESEPWHLRYVGVEVSTDMKEKNINSFEEYHAKYLEKESE